MNQSRLSTVASALLISVGIAAAPALVLADGNTGSAVNGPAVSTDRGSTEAPVNTPGNGPGTPPTASSQPGMGQSGNMTAAQANTALQAQGYSSVGTLTRNGDYFVGQATHNGQTVTVHVNAATGKIE